MDKIVKIQEFSGLELAKAVEVCNAIQSFEQLYHSEIPTLRYFSATYSKEKIEAIICLKISGMLEFLNLKRTMEERQIEVVAEMIVEKYHWLTIWDIDQVFKKAMFGDYGQLYSAIDGTIIFEWFRKYEFERFEEMEKISIETHLARKAGKIEFHPEVTAKIKEILGEKMELNQVKKKAHDPSLIEKRAWEIFSWLDKRQQKTLPKTNIPVILVGGRHYTNDQFTKHYFNKKIENDSNQPPIV